MLDLLFVVLVAIAGAGFFAWQFLRGETVGTVKGLAQGEASVPGATLSIKVKRHAEVGGLVARVEIQFRFLAIAETRQLEDWAGKGLARALREAEPWVRGEA
jgi:hypothetical protein